MQIEKLIKLIRSSRFSGLSADSKAIRNNSIFVAVKGSKLDGSKFIKEALGRGARIIVCDKTVPINRYKNADFIKVKDTRKALAQLAAEFYNHPTRKQKIVAVTGTNGKTTITYLLEAILKERGVHSGVIGTINYRFKNKVFKAKNTTPGPIELQSVLAKMLRENIKYVAMEVSSHALDQDRVLGINFHSAIFTNLTQDHLDYHGTMQKYFLAKAKLFKTMSGESFAVINNDDKYSRKLKMITPVRLITYGIENKSEVMAKNIHFDVSHTEFTLVFNKKEMQLRISLIGRHNVYNTLAVIAWALEEGFSQQLIKKALAKFSFVPGRLERINSKKGFSIFVDYAHTDDALKNILTSLRQLSPKRIITLFGCGGDRDKLKRPKMGNVVTELSDQVVLTSDNSRFEKPMAIIKDILSGIRKSNYCVVMDRAKAIRKALLLARPGDIVVLAGKGHEDYQIVKDKKLHFNDMEEACRCLRSLNY
ncbi:MAG: UDP-N-acetylmuramoyl-L-alanyl-D-glutamate--2,6-diaminopimelate ligase [Candidatus Omnitrophica bacterium]|nr:UDP-N-acetylmuramoyl-L-alanyl-D-glutamate--2,6-diaminopimelate ligase [Candidatus Omnitrophota bacterium]